MRFHVFSSKPIWSTDIWPTRYLVDTTMATIHLEKTLFFILFKCVDQMSFGQISVSQISVGQMSIGQMSVGQMSVGQMFFDQMTWSLQCCKDALGVVSAFLGADFSLSSHINTHLAMLVWIIMVLVWNT